VEEIYCCISSNDKTQVKYKHAWDFLAEVTTQAIL